jgi:hypothetical protein
MRSSSGLVRYQLYSPGTALLVARATAAPPNGTMQSFRNERVKAVVAMSPQGVSEENFQNPSWDHIVIPVLTMSGTHDSGVNVEPPSWRLQPYEHMHPGDKYQLNRKWCRVYHSQLGSAFANASSKRQQPSGMFI